MKKRVISRTYPTELIALIICTAFIISGIVLGFYTSVKLPLAEYGSFALSDPKVRKVLISNCLGAFIIFASGFSFLGCAVIPLVCGFSGFSLSLALSSYLPSLSSESHRLVFLLLLAILCAVRIFALLYLSTHAFTESSLLAKKLLGKSNTALIPFSEYMLWSSYVFLILIVLSLMEAFVFPLIIRFLI